MPTSLKLALFSFFLFIGFSFLEAPKGYSIEGTITGYPDNTVLFLADISKGSYDDIDSAIIKGGRFFFKGKLNSTAQHSSVHTRDFNDRVSFWLQNDKFSIAAVKGKFREAAITGGSIQKQYEEYTAFCKGYEDNHEREKEYIRTFPKSFISAYILNVYSSSWGKQIISDLYSGLAEEVQNNIYGKQVKEFIELNRTIKIGEPFVDFEQMDTNGKMIKLSDFKGKLILLDFWGSWCGPCRESNPELVKLYAKYKEKGFEVFGVAADTRKDWWLKAIKEDGLTWTNVCDLRGDKNKASLMYGVSGYPTNYLIDRNGIIINKNLSGKELEDKVVELLK